MCIESIANPINQCSETGLEYKFPCSFEGVQCFRDNFDNIRLVVDGGIGGILLAREGKRVLVVQHVYVSPEHRLQGLARQLFGLANILFKGLFSVRHSDNLTADGKNFIEGERK